LTCFPKWKINFLVPINKKTPRAARDGFSGSSLSPGRAKVINLMAALEALRLYHTSGSRQIQSLGRPNAQPTTDVNPATSKITLEDSGDAQSAVKSAAEDSDKDNDIWTTAEERLPEDPQKRKKLEEYDRILEAHFGAKLEPIGTPERHEQFRGSLNSEIKRLNVIPKKSA
jgi:hypothetical protein